MVDLVRALQDQDDQRLQRLANGLAQLPHQQRVLALSAVIAAIGRGWVSLGMLKICEELADLLEQHPQLDRVIEWLLPHSERFSVLPLIRKLQQLDHKHLDNILHQLFGHSRQQDALVIVLLAHPQADKDESLIDRGVALLMDSGHEPRDRLALAAALRRLDDNHKLGAMIAERAQDILHSHDTAIFWLLAELSRDQALAAEDSERIYDALIELMRNPRNAHILTSLEQQLPALLPVCDDSRARAVPFMADLIAQFRDQRSRDIIQAVIAKMAPAAITPLWRSLEQHPQALVRRIALKLLPPMLHGLHGEQASDEITEAIHKLIALSKDTSDPSRTCLTAHRSR